MQAVVIFALFSVNWLKQLNEFHKLQNVEHTLIVLANHCITTHNSSRLYFFKLTWIRLFVGGGANGVVAAPLVF